MRKRRKADGAAAPRAAEGFAAGGRRALVGGGRARGGRPAGHRRALLVLLEPQVHAVVRAFSTPRARGARTSSGVGMRGGGNGKRGRPRSPSRAASVCPPRVSPVPAPLAFACGWGVLKARPYERNLQLRPALRARPVLPLVALVSPRCAFLPLVLRGGVPAHLFPCVSGTQNFVSLSKMLRKLTGREQFAQRMSFPFVEVCPLILCLVIITRVIGYTLYPKRWLSNS